MNISEILRLKFPQANPLSDYILQDDGQGPYICEWNISDVEKPTQEDLDVWAEELDLAYRQFLAVSARKYPTLGDQFDMIYKDSLDGGTRFVDAITAVKNNPKKPTE